MVCSAKMMNSLLRGALLALLGFLILIVLKQDFGSLKPNRFFKSQVRRKLVTPSEKANDEKYKSEHSKLWIPPWNENGPKFNGFGPLNYDHSMITRYVENTPLGRFTPNPQTENGYTSAGTLAGIKVHQKCDYTKAAMSASDPWNDCKNSSMKGVYMHPKLLKKDAKPLLGCLDNNTCMDIWINSPGGVGSNLVWNYFRDHGISAGERGFPWGKKLCHLSQPLKHCDVPFVKKAIVLFGDPCTAIFSVFRRNIQRANAEKANMKPLTRAQIQNIKSLSTYLEAGEDDLMLEAHFDQWTTPSQCLGYPILFVKFGPPLWEYLEKILLFLGIPEHFAREMIKDLPPLRPRKTDRFREGKRSLDKCKEMYADLYEKFDNFPDIAFIQV